MANSIQWVIFDLGGVILNFKGSFGGLSSALGIAQPLLEQSYYRHADLAACGMISTAEFWKRILNDVQPVNGAAIADYEEFWTDNFAAIPETHALLRELSGRYRLGIMSNTEFGVYERALRKGHIPTVPFEIVIKSCDVGIVKPDQRIYQIAQDQTGVTPGEILFIDDRPENVKAAQAQGWRGVLFDAANPGQSTAEIRTTLDG
jgi:HAD superfamily hydrolase (TIGR01509 family)